MASAFPTTAGERSVVTAAVQGRHSSYFASALLSETFDSESFLASRPPESRILFAIKAKGRLSVSTAAERAKLGPGDTIVSFGPPAKDRAAEAAEKHSAKKA